MNKNPESPIAALMQSTSDTTSPATPTKRPTPETTQGSHTGVDTVTGEDDAATDAMFTCVHALTGRLPPITRTEFTGGSLPVTAQVLLVINAFGLGEFTTPHVPAETAIHNAIRAEAIQKAQTPPLHDMGVPRKVPRNLNTQEAGGVLGRSARYSKRSPSGAVWYFVLPHCASQALFRSLISSKLARNEAACVGAMWKPSERHTVHKGIDRGRCPTQLSMKCVRTNSPNLRWMNSDMGA